MKTGERLSTIILSVAFICACTNTLYNEDEPIESSGAPIKISSFNLHSQVFTNDQNEEAIGVYVTAASSNISKTRYISNEKYICTSSGFNSVNDVRYPSGVNCNIFSYFPYQEKGIKEKSYEMTISVQTDQSSDYNYNMSDFMVAEKLDVEESDNNVSMSFNHVFNELDIRISVPDGTDMEKFKEMNPEIFLCGTYTSADYDINTKEFFNYAAMKPITPNGEWIIDGNTLIGKRVLIVPQLIDADTKMVKATINDKTFYISMGRDYQAEAGESNKLTINYSSQGESPSINYDISNWNFGGTIMSDLVRVVEQNCLVIDDIDFTESPIKEVDISMSGIAMICKELLYNNDMKHEAIVLYPLVNDKMDMSNGTVLKIIDEDRKIHGGKIVWDKINNTFTYTSGNSAPTERLFFYSDGSFGTENREDCKSVELLDIQYTDRRGDERNIYNYVKIGTQIWQVENLATKVYDGGKEITKKTSSNTSSAAGYFTDDSGNIFYNQKAIESGKLVKRGTTIANYADWTMLRSYLHNDASLIRATTGWSSTECNDMSGFKALPIGGYLEKSNGKGASLQSAGSSAMYWVTDESQDETWKTAILVDSVGEIKDISYTDYSAFAVKCLTEY
jgi:uncharacterized protein (TIGR02145 family)